MRDISPGKGAEKGCNARMVMGNWTGRKGRANRMMSGKRLFFSSLLITIYSLLVLREV